MGPLTWIRRIKEHIPALQEIPLFGSSPPFDWDLFSKKLSEEFQVDDIQIHPKEQRFLEEHEIKQGLGEDLFTLPIDLTPLGTAYWIMSRADVNKLTSWLLKPISKTRAVSSEILQEGFYRYLILESLNILQEIKPFPELTLQLSDEQEEISRSFCIDLELHFNGKNGWGRLAIPDRLRSAWASHFSHANRDYIPKEIAKQIELKASVQTGSVLLKQSEWDEIKVGDFLLLDRESYDIKHQSGFAKISLETTPLFHAKINPNQIEIIDFAPIQEDFMTENEKSPPEEKLQDEITSIQEIPMLVSVEIAKIKLTLDRLMHISPGEMLELPIDPAQGVSLLINGRKVGRAELVYLGEKLGVRIVELGQ